MTWRFSRSSGPGGQSVNTTDSRVELVWDLDASTTFDASQKNAIAAALRSRLRGGVVTVASSQYKSQHRNREAARVRLEELVTRALQPTRPRHATKPSRAARQRRLDAKKHRSSDKALRRRPPL